MEGGTANEDPTPSPGKYNIFIAWEILHTFWRIINGLLFLADLCWADPL